MCLRRLKYLLNGPLQKKCSIPRLKQQSLLPLKFCELTQFRWVVLTLKLSCGVSQLLTWVQLVFIHMEGDVFYYLGTQLGLFLRNLLLVFLCGLHIRFSQHGIRSISMVKLLRDLCRRCKAVSFLSHKVVFTTIY